MMKFFLFLAIVILIPIIGLQAEEVIDDMVILEGTFLYINQGSQIPLYHTYCFLFLLPE